MAESISPDARWDLSDHLLAVVADAVIQGNWMQSRDGQKNRNRPKPIQRPGIEASKKFGGKAEPVAAIRDWLGWGPTTPEKYQRPRDARGRYMKTE